MKAIASFFYVGFLKPAPGTWGSLAALPVAYAILLIGGFWLLIAATVAAFALGLWATRRLTEDATDHDPRGSSSTRSSASGSPCSRWVTAR